MNTLKIEILKKLMIILIFQCIQDTMLIGKETVLRIKLTPQSSTMNNARRPIIFKKKKKIIYLSWSIACNWYQVFVINSSNMFAIN